MNSKKIEKMTKSWIDSGEYCDQDVMDLVALVKQLAQALADSDCPACTGEESVDVKLPCGCCWDRKPCPLCADYPGSAYPNWQAAVDSMEV